MAEYCEKETIYKTLYSKLRDEVSRTTGERRDFCFEILDKLKAWCDEIITADVRENVEWETIYGYDIKELAVFAAACRQEGITESEMHDFCLNAGAAVDCVMREMDRVQKETFDFERIIHGFGADMRGEQNGES